MMLAALRSQAEQRRHGLSFDHSDELGTSHVTGIEITMNAPFLAVEMPYVFLIKSPYLKILAEIQ